VEPPVEVFAGSSRASGRRSSTRARRSPALRHRLRCRHPRCRRQCCRPAHACRRSRCQFAALPPSWRTSCGLARRLRCRPATLLPAAERAYCPPCWPPATLHLPVVCPVALVLVTRGATRVRSPLSKRAGLRRPHQMQRCRPLAERHPCWSCSWLSRLRSHPRRRDLTAATSSSARAQSSWSCSPAEKRQ